MAGSYVHVKCGKRVKDSAYHCAACHRSFIGLSAFDGHRVADGKQGYCEMDIAADPYTATYKQFWIDEEGYWHRGQKMTDEQKAEIWGKPTEEFLDEEWARMRG